MNRYLLTTLTFLLLAVSGKFLSAETNNQSGNRTEKDELKLYSSYISAGYNRTHDSSRFYPESGEGSFYMSAGLIYDPSSSIHSDTTLGQVDYLSFDVNMAVDTSIRENYFNVDLILFGKNKYAAGEKFSRRTLFGFFNGAEYYRPGFHNRVIIWSRDIYPKQPHIQYVIWRAIQGTLINEFSNSESKIRTELSAAFGPSINSSLTATGITPEEENDLSPIFKSIKYRKQNYYNSAVVQTIAKISIDKIMNCKFGAGYNFYFFFPIEKEKARDIMHVLKLSAGYYLMDNILINLNYEYWNLSSMVNDKKKSHWWNRMIAEIKVSF